MAPVSRSGEEGSERRDEEWVEEPPLSRAARRSDLFQVQALLRDLCDPNERDAAGERPLLAAAATGDLNVAALLLGYSADPAHARAGAGDVHWSPEMRLLFKVFAERRVDSEARRSVLTMLDPGAQAQARNFLRLGEKKLPFPRSTMSPLSVLLESVIQEGDATADHRVTLHVADPSRPVLRLDPLWQEPTATVLLFHGLFQSARMLSRLARDLSRALPHARLVAPTAPTRPSPWGIGPCWFHGGGDAAAEQLEEARSEVLELLRHEHRAGKGRGAALHRVVLAGFSQGGVVAAWAALRSREPVAGILLLGVPNAWELLLEQGDEAWPGAEGLAVLQCHGGLDEMVSPEEAWSGAEHLRRGGCHVRFSLHHDVGHTVSDAMLAEARSWVRQRIPPDEAAAGDAAPPCSVEPADEAAEEGRRERRGTQVFDISDGGRSEEADSTAGDQHSDLDAMFGFDTVTPTPPSRHHEELSGSDGDGEEGAAPVHRPAAGRRPAAADQAAAAASPPPDRGGAEAAAGQDAGEEAEADTEEAPPPPPRRRLFAWQTLLAAAGGGRAAEDAKDEARDGDGGAGAGAPPREAVGDRRAVEEEDPIIQDAGSDCGSCAAQGLEPEVVEEVELEAPPQAAPAPQPPEAPRPASADETAVPSTWARGVSEEGAEAEPSALAAESDAAGGLVPEALLGSSTGGGPPEAELGELLRAPLRDAAEAEAAELPPRSGAALPAPSSSPAVEGAARLPPRSGTAPPPVHPAEAWAAEAPLGSSAASALPPPCPAEAQADEAPMGSSAAVGPPARPVHPAEAWAAEAPLGSSAASAPPPPCPAEAQADEVLVGSSAAAGPPASPASEAEESPRAARGGVAPAPAAPAGRPAADEAERPGSGASEEGEAMERGLAGEPPLRPPAAESGPTAAVAAAVDTPATGSAAAAGKSAAAGEAAALESAVRNGDLQAVKAMLRRRVDPNARGRLGETPLFEAARRGHADVAAVLLLGKSDPGARSERGALPADSAAPPALGALLRLALGVPVGAQEQRAAFEVLEECTRFLVARLLAVRGARVAVADVLCAAEWDAACSN